MNDRSGKPRTVEQLRDDIDSGHTGDKVPAADPAAAPLGADDEAAGTSTPPGPPPPGPDRAKPGAVKAHSTSSEGARTTRVALVAGGGLFLALIILAALFWT